ncbi:MAG: hypothetical protein KDN05_18130, partial [Verrucomicrobiae bacterium]|nr:hypothetical protein [Verrucomicrobiae bacterium]
MIKAPLILAAWLPLCLPSLHAASAPVDVMVPAGATVEARKTGYLRFAAKDLLAKPPAGPHADSFKLQGVLASIVDVK